MLFKSRAIVLNFIKYRETSIITNIYTEAFGLRSYIVNSVRSKQSKKGKIALFQPLSLLDLVIYEKKTTGLQRISEASCLHPLKTIPFDVKKSAIALFLTEILHKCLKQEDQEIRLFGFLFDSVCELDLAEKKFENFHLHFLVTLAMHLGFAPSSSKYFIDQLSHYINQKDFAETENIDKILSDLLVRSNSTSLDISNSQRQQILDLLLSFYQLQLPGMGNIKSVKVLHEVMKS